MKRPQFGIRLMLLVLTLAASIFAWRRAEGTYQLGTSGLARINADTRLIDGKWSKLGEPSASRPDKFLVHPSMFVTDGELSLMEDEVRQLNANKPSSMRFRFTIRDLLWLTVVVVLAVGWWLDHHPVNPPAAPKPERWTQGVLLSRQRSVRTPITACMSSACKLQLHWEWREASRGAGPAMRALLGGGRRCCSSPMICW